MLHSDGFHGSKNKSGCGAQEAKSGRPQAAVLATVAGTRVQLDTVSALGTRGGMPSCFAGAARMAASTGWRHASSPALRDQGGILPPTHTVFHHTRGTPQGLQFWRGGRLSRRLVSSEPCGDGSLAKADSRPALRDQPPRPTDFAPRCAGTTRNRASQRRRNVNRWFPACSGLFRLFAQRT